MSFSDHFYSITPLHNLLGKILAKYIHLLADTCTFQVEGKGHYESAMESQKPVFYVTWHQQLMPLISFGLKTFDINRFVVMVEGKNRGSILSILANSIHANAFKIDMQDRSLAGSRRILSIIRSMKAGKYSLLAPDGPYGPPCNLKPGALFIAQKANAALVPCGAWTLQGYQLNRWDRYLVVLPYSKLFIVFGEPIRVSDYELDIRNLESVIANEMHATRCKARELAGETRKDLLLT